MCSECLHVHDKGFWATGKIAYTVGVCIHCYYYNHYKKPFSYKPDVTEEELIEHFNSLIRKSFQRNSTTIVNSSNVDYTIAAVGC